MITKCLGSEGFCSTLSSIIRGRQSSKYEKVNYHSRIGTQVKVEKSLKGSLDLIPSASVKIQTTGGNVCLRFIGKTLLGIVNNLLKAKSLLTSPSNVLPYFLK